MCVAKGAKQQIRMKPTNEQIQPRGERRPVTPNTPAMESEIKAQSRNPDWAGAQAPVPPPTPLRPSHLLDHVPTILRESPRARPQAETPQMATHPLAVLLPSAAPSQRAFAPLLDVPAPRHW
jgi:hypothetical protein